MKNASGNTELQDLATCRLFRGVESHIATLVMRASAPLKLSPGQYLFERGDAGDILYVLLKGRLEVSAITESGRKISLNRISAGECIGEISMFDNFPRSASIIALDDAVLQPMSKPTFILASSQSTTLALNMIDILCDRFRWASNSVEDFAILSLERRLARRLLLLDERFSDPQGEISITQNDLADFVGASREATNKILMQWKSFGLIDIRRGALKLTSRESLDRMAHDGY